MNTPIFVAYRKQNMRGNLAGASLTTKLVALGLIWLFSSIFFNLLGVVSTALIFPHLDGGITALLGGVDQLDADVLKYLQVFSATGMFVIPTAIFTYLTSEPNEDLLGLQKPIKGILGLLVVAIIIAIVPIVDALTTVFHQIPFPELLSDWRVQLEQYEKESLNLVNKMLAGNTLRDLASNLIVIAIVPAVGEELLFRGVLQPLFHKHLKNALVAIFITSLIFAAMHQQFFNLGSLFFISFLLGLIRWWTNNLWLCMLGHFVNNAAYVLLTFFGDPTLTESSPFANNYLWLIGSVILSTVILVAIFRSRNNFNL